LLAGVTKLVQSPKDDIPFFVRLEGSKEYLDFRRQFLAVFLQIFSPKFFSSSERKFDRPEAGVAAGHSSSVSSLVENRAQIVGGVKEDIGEISGQSAVEPNFVKVVDAIDIFLDHMGPRLAPEESATPARR